MWVDHFNGGRRSELPVGVDDGRGGQINGEGVRETALDRLLEQNVNIGILCPKSQSTDFIAATSTTGCVNKIVSKPANDKGALTQRKESMIKIHNVASIARCCRFKWD